MEAEQRTGEAEEAVADAGGSAIRQRGSPDQGRGGSSWRLAALGNRVRGLLPWLEVCVCVADRRQGSRALTALRGSARERLRGGRDGARSPGG